MLLATDVHFLQQTISKDLDLSKHQERRRYPRTKIKLPVVKMAADGLVDGEIQDLSLGGAFIRCSAMPNNEHNFHMVISARGRLISITGEMVWSDVNESNDKNRLRGMGVRFRKVFNGDRRVLLDVIGKQQKNIFSAWLPKKP